MSYLIITGVLPPMATPFTDGGEVHYAKHIRNLERWN
jgi:dihydrodipicolinate synthase/N-acetylneuraminate lyase